MPASMIIADTGSSVNEIGNSIATVVTGPIPGSTPTTVPRNTPMKQYSRFCTLNATPKPIERLCRMSMLERRPYGQRQPPPVHEHNDREHGEHQRQRRDLKRLGIPAR